MPLAAIAETWWMQKKRNADGNNINACVYPRIVNATDDRDAHQRHVNFLSVHQRIRKSQDGRGIDELHNVKTSQWPR